MGEHIIETADGKAIRVRRVNCVAEEDRWKLDATAALRSLPRKPNPASASHEPQAQTVHVRRRNGADLGQPDMSDNRGGPCERQITNTILKKYGYSNGCTDRESSAAFADLQAAYLR